MAEPGLEKDTNEPETEYSEEDERSREHHLENVSEEFARFCRKKRQERALQARSQSDATNTAKAWRNAIDRRNHAELEVNRSVTEAAVAASLETYERENNDLELYRQRLSDEIEADSRRREKLKRSDAIREIVETRLFRRETNDAMQRSLETVEEDRVRRLETPKSDATNELLPDDFWVLVFARLDCTAVRLLLRNVCERFRLIVDERAPEIYCKKCLWVMVAMIRFPVKRYVSVPKSEIDEKRYVWKTANRLFRDSKPACGRSVHGFASYQTVREIEFRHPKAKEKRLRAYGKNSEKLCRKQPYRGLPPREYEDRWFDLRKLFENQPQCYPRFVRRLWCRTADFCNACVRSDNAKSFHRHRYC